jgi:hypothetical protein
MLALTFTPMPTALAPANTLGSRPALPCTPAPLDPSPGMEAGIVTLAAGLFGTVTVAVVQLAAHRVVV